VRNKVDEEEKMTSENLQICEKLPDMKTYSTIYTNVNWIPPPEEFCKINVGASFHASTVQEG
jgi:hypothetical protein